jgi:hypothetical protein
MDWFYVDVDEQQIGPHDEDDMAAMIAGGKIMPETLVWTEGYPDWVAARSVTEFSPLFVDYGDQATMVGGMTLPQGFYETPVQAPEYVLRHENGPAPVKKADKQGTGSTPGFFGILQRIMQFFGSLGGKRK